MALKCAIQLSILDAIHNHGKPMTLSELINALPCLHPTKAPSLHRLLRLLVHCDFLSEQKITSSNVEDQVGFTLTLNSELLLKDNLLTLAHFVLNALSPTQINLAHHLSSWFVNDDESPFHIAYGRSLWEHASDIPEFNDNFNESMASDTRFVASLLVNNNQFKGLFEGIESLVDVAGGVGIMAKAIAKACPWLKCVVLDLPHVVDKLQDNASNLIAYVGGDIFEAIPSADAILLKWILHDWSDDHCIKILKRCKEAIPSQDDGGKVIIIDMVLESPNDTGKPYSSAQLLFDLKMLDVTIGGKERTEEEWKKLFICAGFNDFKIFPILGSRSVIVLYP